MKLKLKTDIELFVDNNEVLNITARKLTKKESKTFSEDIDALINTGKEYSSIKRKLKHVTAKNDLAPTVELIDDIYNLEEELAGYGANAELKIADEIEELYKRKLETIIEGKDAKKVLKIADDFGYMNLDSELSDSIKKANDQGN